MSMSLLKRSLDIVEEDLPDKAKKAKSKAIKNVDERNFYNNKSFKYLNKNNSLNHKEKLTVEEIKKRAINRDKTEENVAKLLKLSEIAPKVDQDTKEKIFQRAYARHYVVPKEEKKKEEKSIFTEEDFRKFEKEYFGR